MTPQTYVVLAYALGLALLWGFALWSWSVRRSLARRLPRDPDPGV